MSTSVPWKLDDDLDSTIAWLSRRDDVDDRRIGAVGVSLGGEVALHTAARAGPSCARSWPRASSAAVPTDLRHGDANPLNRIDRYFAQRGGASVQHWNLPAASHGSAIRAEPARYEQRVGDFLDRALLSP